MVVVRLDHGKGHDVIASSTDSNSTSCTPTDHLLSVHLVVCVVLELKLLLLLQLTVSLAAVTLSRVLLFRLQSLLVCTSARGLYPLALFCRVFLRLFILSIYVIRLVA